MQTTTTVTTTTSTWLFPRTRTVLVLCAIAAACSSNGPSPGEMGSTQGGGGSSSAGASGGPNAGGNSGAGVGGSSSTGGAGAGAIPDAAVGAGGSAAGGGAGAAGSGGGATGTGGAPGRRDAGIADGAAGSRAVADSATEGGGTAGRDAARDAAPSVRPDASGAPLTVFIAGDSTVMTYVDTPALTDQAGWGQMLHEYFNASATIDNRAIGGRTARRFIEEGHLDDILADIKAGDYLLVQFGTNDSNTTATYVLNGVTIPYFLAANTDFKTYLMQYVDGARAKSATPVLVTPPPRNSAYCTGGNGLAAYAQAMRDLGAAQGIAVSDLNAKTVAYLRAICPSPTPENFFLVLANGSVDGTHFQENGARIMAGFVADGIREDALPLAFYLK